MTEAFRNLKFSSDTNAAIAINSYYVGNGFSAVVINDAQTQCTQAAGLLTDEEKSYQQYFNGDLPIPADAHHSPLRTYYSNLQHYTYCHFHDYEDPMTVLSLIFFDSVMKNFGRYYLNDIQAANQMLRAHGLADSQILNFYRGNHTRKEVLDNITMAENITTNTFSDKESSQFSDLTQHLSGYLRSLSCIPSTWITEDPNDGERPQAPDPSCNTPDED